MALADDLQEIPSELEKPKWANLFKGNRLAAQGMTLQYVAPIVRDGETLVELCKTEVDMETFKWKHALMLYVVGADPTIAAVERFIAATWNYLVKFTCIDDRDEVLYSGPHMMNNKLVIVKTWATNFDFNKEVMQTIPLWVKFPNLPLNWWEAQSLSRIASGIGVPLYADECTTQVDRISYARVLIEMDITKAPSKELKVEDPNGMQFTKAITYEWVPIYCLTCLTIGHTCQAKDGSGRNLDHLGQGNKKWNGNIGTRTKV